MAGILDWLMGDPKTVTYDMPKNTDYPDQAAVDRGRLYDLTYGQPAGGILYREPGKEPNQRLSQVPSDVFAQAYNRGIKVTPDQAMKPLSSQTQDELYKAWLASQNSAIAALGFDPYRMTVSPEKGKDLSVAGMYNPKNDAIWAYLGNEPSAPVHESIHRGFKMLRDAGLEAPKEGSKTLYPGMDGEEMMTRMLMERLFPGIEGGDKQAKQARDALKAFPKDNNAYIDRMEKAASELIAKRTPRGPR